MTWYEKFLDKKIRVTFTDDNSFVVGRCVGYTSAMDNDPDPASIEVRTDGDIQHCIYEDEIKKIEEIS